MNHTVLKSENMSTPQALAVADYFIKKYRTEQPATGLTNKKLQKLLYYSQAWSLVLRDKEMFPDKIEAWVHGPAIRGVYLKFKDYGYGNIDKEVPSDEVTPLTQDDKNLLDAVWKLYGKYDAQYLEELSHSELPWQKARGDLKEYESSSMEITKDSMKAFYEKKLSDSKG